MVAGRTAVLVRRCVSLVLLLVVAGAGCHRAAVAPAPVRETIEVEVRTAADTVPQFARVGMRVGDDTVVRYLQRRADGRFEGALTPGLAELRLAVSVPQHWTTETVVLLPPERPARFVLRPRALIPRDSMPRPRVVGDFNDFKSQHAVPLLRGTDGVLRATVPFRGDSSRFLLYGVGGPDDDAWMPVRSWAISPDSSDGVRFAGVLRPVTDSLHFVLDARPLGVAYRRPAAIETQTADSAIALVNQLVLERRDAQMYKLILREMRPSESETAFRDAIAHATALTARERHPRVRAAAYVSLMTLFTAESPRPVEAARGFLEVIPPGSPVLRTSDDFEAASRAIVFRDTMPFANARDSAQRINQNLALRRAYLEPVARDKSRPRDVRASAYMNLVYGSMGVVPQADLDAVIDEAVAAMPEHPSIKTLPTSFGRLRVLREGAPFPTFTMRALGDTLTAPVTNETFRGKLTLVDFWGMWCAPCVQEMPVLHAAYSKYASKGFTILSIDTDLDLDAVAAFRKSKWPMPWLHGWAGDGPFSPALRSLGVTGFPTAVLVDREGRIIAVNAGLRGAQLDKTLARLLP